jgi:hypothetical protein
MLRSGVLMTSIEAGSRIIRIAACFDERHENMHVLIIYARTAAVLRHKREYQPEFPEYSRDTLINIWT